MGELPAGVVTFVMTDIGGSTALWAKDSEAMARSMARHDALAKECLAGHGGRLLKSRGEGDSLFAVFASASHALRSIAAFHRGLAEDEMLSGMGLRVRAAVHSGDDYIAEPGDYRGNTPNRCARLRDAAHPGQTVVSHATAALVEDALDGGMALRPLGTHKLRDLARPEEVFQLVVDGLASEFLPLRTLSTYANNLPIQLTTFVGRTSEIAAVQSKVRSARLVTLKGAGGCGKTRLALQAVAELSADFPDGTWLVDLSDVRHEDHVPALFARILCDREPAHDGQLSSLASHLSARQTLVVVDNCEHVAAACADAITHILLHCPRLTVLATSRQLLGVQGETVYEVPTMALPKTEEFGEIEEALESDAVRLFVERATARDPGFAPCSNNIRSIVGLCKALDGLPLAIELAAANAHLLTPAQMESHLGMAVMRESGTRGVPSRHKTLRATLQWSVDRLDADARRLLPRLSVFVGGWSLETGAAVCCEDPAAHGKLLGALDALVKQSLVVAGVEDHGERRYRLLETTRQFAATLLGQAEPTVRSRHFETFLKLALDAEPNLLGDAQAEWFARLDAEYENLLAALNWGDRHTDVRIPDFALALAAFWQFRGKLRDGRRWLERCAGYPGQTGLLRAQVLRALGALCQRQSDYACARSALEEAMRAFQQVESPLDVAIVSANLAGVLSHEGDLAGARARFSASREAFAKAGEDRYLAFVLLNLGVLDLDEGRYDEGVGKTFEEAAAAAGRAGNCVLVAIAQGNLGEVLVHLGRHAQAAEALHDAFEYWRAMPDPNDIATSLIDVARLCLVQGLDGEALYAIACSDALFVQSGSKLTGRQEKYRQQVLDQVGEAPTQPSILSPPRLHDDVDARSVAAMAATLLDRIRQATEADEGAASDLGSV